MKSIIISGATGGLGRALTHHLAGKFPNDQFILFGRSQQKLDQLKEHVQQEHPETDISILRADFSDSEWAEELSEENVLTKYSVRFLIHNAGFYSVSTLDEIGEEEMNTAYRVNVTAPIQLTQLLDSCLSVASHIVGIGSLGSYTGLADAGYYATTKHALLGFLRSLREQYRERGVKVTAILPGPIYTDSWHGSGVDKKKLIQPEDICKIVSNLAELSQSTNVDEIVLNPVRFNR